MVNDKEMSSEYHDELRVFEETARRGVEVDAKEDPTKESAGAASDTGSSNAQSAATSVEKSSESTLSSITNEDTRPACDMSLEELQAIMAAKRRSSPPQNCQQRSSRSSSSKRKPKQLKTSSLKHGN